MPEPSAPKWLRDRVNGRDGGKRLLGVKYLDATSPKNPNTDPSLGFDCWGWTWYYLNLTGLVIPKDPFEAEKQFTLVTTTRWRDVVSYKNFITPIPHCGVMEDAAIVLHCSSTVGAVSRADIMYPPWRNHIRILRHNSLL